MASQLATLAQLKEYLAVTDTTDDALLTRLLDVCATSIEKWCSRTFAPADYSLTLDGNGRTRIVVDQWPIVSIASLTIDGNTIPASTGPKVNGYTFSGYRIDLRGYQFEVGAQNVEVSFRAGYTTVPSDVTQACIKLAALRYRERDRLGVSSKGIAGEQIVFVNDDFPESIERVLNDYKSVVTL